MTLWHKDDLYVICYEMFNLCSKNANVLCSPKLRQSKHFVIDMKILKLKMFDVRTFWGYSPSALITQSAAIVLVITIQLVCKIHLKNELDVGEFQVTHTMLASFRTGSSEVRERIDVTEYFHGRNGDFQETMVFKYYLQPFGKDFVKGNNHLISNRCIREIDKNLC